MTVGNTKFVEIKQNVHRKVVSRYQKRKVYGKKRHVYTGYIPLSGGNTLTEP